MALAVPRFDSLSPFENAFFQQALQSVAARTYDIKYPNLYARQFIPTSNEVHPGAETYRYYQFARAGGAKIAKSYSTAVRPIALNVKNFDQPVRSLRAAYEYNIQELRAQALARQNGQQVNLDVQQPQAARYFIEKAIDDIAQLGDAANGLNGLLNHPNIPVYTSGHSINGSWSGLTFPADSGKVIADVTALFSQIQTTTKQVEFADTLLLPIAKRNILANNLVSTAGSKSILQWLLESVPGLKSIEPWYALEGIGSGNTDRMMAYRKDPTALQLIVPQEFEMLPPVQSHLAFLVDCHARCGGVVTYFPLSATYADNI